MSVDTMSAKNHQHKQHRTEKQYKHEQNHKQANSWIPQMKNTTDKYLNDTNTHKAYLYTLVTQPFKPRKKLMIQTHHSELSQRYRTCMCNG